MTLFSRVMMKTSLVNTFLVVNYSLLIIGDNKVDGDGGEVDGDGGDGDGDRWKWLWSTSSSRQGAGTETSIP
jgi:hypothetical protein